MIEAAVLIISALIMAGIYCRTDRPKLYAFLNTAAGVACLFALDAAAGTQMNNYSAALAAIFGVPGALLRFALGML